MKELYLIYLDESYNDECFVYAGIIIPASRWNKLFAKIFEWRLQLLKKHKIPLDYELHATKFAGGRGNFDGFKDKDKRAKMFTTVLKELAQLKNIRIIGGYTKDKTQKDKLFDAFIYELDKFLESKKAYGILVCDEGNEQQLISQVRRARKNEMEGDLLVKFALDRIIEDPLFKNSKSSYFIQFADFVAFTMLKNFSNAKKTHPELIKAYKFIENLRLETNNLDDNFTRP